MGSRSTHYPNVTNPPNSNNQVTSTNKVQLQIRQLIYVLFSEKQQIAFFRSETIQKRVHRFSLVFNGQ